MTAYEAIIYGLIQGLSEFLPISSSGHLALLPHVMRIDDPGVAFDLMMHLGTAMAVVVYFKNDIFRYLKTFTPSLVDIRKGNSDQWFVRNFIFATFISVLAIVLFMPAAKSARDPWFIIINLSVFGLFLWVADRINQKMSVHLESPMESKLQLKMAGMIGLAQALAIFPGVSRSGITLTVALILGMKRKDAGAFSFLLSLPIIFAGILKEVPDLMKEGNDDRFFILFLGIATSFIVGFLTVHFFMKVISKIQLGYFTIYRWVIALVMYLTL